MMDKKKFEKMVEEKTVEQKQEEALMLSDLDPETKAKIRTKYWELVKKFPRMKRHRLMRKAGEFYKIKFEFE